MLSSTQLKNNTCFIHQDQPYKVLQYKHTHLGRGGANIKVKVRNLKSNNVLHLNFTANDKFEELSLEKKEMQFLYQDGGRLYFMDPKTFEQIDLDSRIIGQGIKYLKEQELINIIFWQDKVLDIDLPASIVVEIAECDPGLKGNSAVNMHKSALTKEGLKIKVPLFCQKGEKVKIDTSTGEYVERAE